MLINRKLLLLGCLILMSVTNSSAEESLNLGDITVTAARELQAESRVETITPATNATPAMTVVDIIENIAGVDVQRRSILTPKSSQVRLRGFDERRYLVLLDNRPLNGAGVMGGYFVDWSALAMTNWQNIEISRGAYSAKYGNTLGGYLNLQPLRPTTSNELEIHSGIQRYGTFNAGLTARMKRGDLGIIFTANHNKTDGYLRNSEANRQDISTSLFYDIPDGEINFAARLMTGKFNMPVENNIADALYNSSFPQSKGQFLTGPWLSFPIGDKHGDTSNYEKNRQEFDLTLKKELINTSFVGKLYYNNESRTDEIYSYNTGALVLQRDTNPDRTWGWKIDMSLPLNEHQFALGFDGNYQGFGGVYNTFVSSSYFARPPHTGPDEWDATRRHGFYVDDTWSVKENFDLYLGLRLEKYEGDQSVDAVTGYNAFGKPTGTSSVDVMIDDTTLQPKIGLAYRPTAGVDMHVNIARATRMPDNPAFYWYYSGWRPEIDSRVDIKRKALTYEDANEYEVGLTINKSPALNGELSCYYNRVKDYIRWIYGYSPSRVVYNIDKVDFWGVELTLNNKITDSFSTFANLAYQKTKKEGDVLDGTGPLTDELTELPKLKVNIGADYQFTSGVKTKITMRYVGARKVPILNDTDAPDGTAIFASGVKLVELDNFVTADFLCTIPLKKAKWQSSLTVGVNNIFNQGYEEEFDVPAPERVYSAVLDVKF